ncbi:DUF6233 domain-containing protein [Streptomyces huasconensis]|uniref:DUF6233 domain-containing protein n=1 Tax=Streptomyces huasconensis TaxID=1854574 RepID=A0ABV3M4I7_9ACTN
MSDIRRIDVLRFLERVQERDLARTRRWIADEERREAERIRGRQARPPAPDWLIELGIGQGKPAVCVHVGGCHMAGQRTRGADLAQARQALSEGVTACIHCRPDTELGVLD